LTYTCWTEDGGCGATFAPAEVDASMVPVRKLLDAVAAAQAPEEKAEALQRLLQEAIGPGRLLPPEHEVAIRARLNLAMSLERRQVPTKLVMCEEQLAEGLRAMGLFLSPLWPEQAEWWARLGHVRLAAAETASTPQVAAEHARGAAAAYETACQAMTACAGTEHPLAVWTRLRAEAALQAAAVAEARTSAGEKGMS